MEGRDANLYRYCDNTPTNATDPSGMSVLGKTLKGAIEKASEKAIKEAVEKEVRDNWYKFLTRLLKEYGLSEIKQAHHIIVQKLFGNGKLAEFFKEIGILKDEFKNIVPLFTKKAAQAAVDVGEEALHAGRHIKDYVKLVEDPLQVIRRAYEAGKYGEKGTDAAIKAAREAVEKVQEDIRKKLLDGTIRLQHYDTPGNRKAWKQGATAIMALALASGMSEAEAEEVAMSNIERMVAQESYYRQKNVIVRYGQAGYYTKDSNSKVARWTAFAADFFNPVDDVITVTDLLEDASKFAARTGIKVIYVVGNQVEKVLLNYFDSAWFGQKFTLATWQEGWVL